MSSQSIEKTIKVKAPPSAESFENTQIDLFQQFLCNTEEQRQSLSNTIDFWDHVPKYCYSQVAQNKLRTSEELKEKSVFMSVTSNRPKGSRQKITDILYSATPHPEFIKCVKASIDILPHLKEGDSSCSNITDGTEPVPAADGITAPFTSQANPA